MKRTTPILRGVLSLVMALLLFRCIPACSQAADDTPDRLKLTLAELQLVNDEVLYLKGRLTAGHSTAIPDDVEPQIKLIVEGLTSRAVKTLTPGENGITVNRENGRFIFVLDDITTDEKRFCRQFATPDAGSRAFIFGEDIRVTAEVFSGSAPEASDKASVVGNSLFQYVKTSPRELGINKIRHLQNLSNAVSGVELQRGSGKLGIVRVRQTADLVWDQGDGTGGFVNFKRPGDGASEKLGGNIYYDNDKTVTHTDASFLPVDVMAQMIYDAGYSTGKVGKVNAISSHSISNLVVNAENAGLFGTVGKANVLSMGEGRYLLAVTNLDIYSAEITGTANAGAVAANVQKSVALAEISIHDASVTLTPGSTGSAGGAVGRAVNGLDITAVTVSGTSVQAPDGMTGGLVGVFDGITGNVHFSIKDCNVINEENGKTIDGSDAAAGLIGKITRGLPLIVNSYSTISAGGDAAEGQIGTE